ncbi:unnamed protein product [Vicia faba]|uniref:Uncharacterized protein n=1 Tax=Vicia faba TaxID=3906 RepID=A0AAV0ZV17_VICFA|nr:unnamed protein product [Vicia faba]
MTNKNRTEEGARSPLLTAPVPLQYDSQTLSATHLTTTTPSTSTSTQKLASPHNRDAPSFSNSAVSSCTRQPTTTLRLSPFIHHVRFFILFCCFRYYVFWIFVCFVRKKIERWGSW